METLTAERLSSAETQWRQSRPGFYRVVIEMSGDRVETGRFEVTVTGGKVASLRRNGQPISPGRGDDYTVDGLFEMLHREMELSQTPSLLSAPPGYSAYLMARFDSATGRLEEYRRSVGGTGNNIHVKILEYEPR